MTPTIPRFRMRFLAIRRQRLALQNSLHKITLRLQNLVARMESLEAEAIALELPQSSSTADSKTAFEEVLEFEEFDQPESTGKSHSTPTGPKRNPPRRPNKRVTKRP
jgi:hypothetical protein